MQVRKQQLELDMEQQTGSMPSNHLILCRPLLLLPSVFPSIRVLGLNKFQLCWVSTDSRWSSSYPALTAGLIVSELGWTAVPKAHQGTSLTSELPPLDSWKFLLVR